MASATVRWLPGGLTFVGTDSTMHSVVVSPASEGTGVRPTDLMLIALASCTAVSVVGILEKKRTPLSALEIEARGEQDPNPPWTFRRVYLHFKLQGSGLTERAVEHAIRVAEEKYCSIAANLHATAEISTSFEILPDQQSEEWQALGTSAEQ